MDSDPVGVAMSGTERGPFGEPLTPLDADEVLEHALERAASDRYSAAACQWRKVSRAGVGVPSICIAYTDSAPSLDGTPVSAADGRGLCR